MLAKFWQLQNVVLCSWQRPLDWSILHCISDFSNYATCSAQKHLCICYREVTWHMYLLSHPPFCAILCHLHCAFQFLLRQLIWKRLILLPGPISVSIMCLQPLINVYIIFTGGCLQSTGCESNRANEWKTDAATLTEWKKRCKTSILPPVSLLLVCVKIAPINSLHAYIISILFHIVTTTIEGLQCHQGRLHLLTC